MKKKTAAPKRGSDGTLPIFSAAGTSLGVLIVLAAFYGDNFAPTKSIIEFSGWATPTLFIPYTAFIAHSIFRETNEHSTFRKAIALLIAIPILYLVTRSTVTSTIPKAVNYIIGTEITHTETATKKDHGRRISRGAGCRYRAKPDNVTFRPFRFCISRDLYEALPEGSFEAQFKTRSSAVGTSYEEISVATEAVR